VKASLIIVRYGEIGLKADYTRKSFENILIKNIKNSLKKENIDFKIESTRGRIFVHTKEIDKTINILQRIFGIKSVSPCFKTNSSLDSMKTFISQVIQNKITSETSFALKVRREGNHDYTSRDVAVLLGNEVAKKTKAKVNLSKPDVTLYIEIRDKNAFFFFDKYLGPGGLPLGAQGKILSVIDSKNESFLAVWYMMRRGCIPVFLISDEKLVDDLKIFGDKWFFKPRTIDSSEKHNSLDNICLENDCSAAVTGDTMQSFPSIVRLKNDFTTPILFPLISMDEKEIKNKIMELGLF